MNTNLQRSNKLSFILSKDNGDNEMNYESNTTSTAGINTYFENCTNNNIQQLPTNQTNTVDKNGTNYMNLDLENELIEFIRAETVSLRTVVQEPETGVKPKRKRANSLQLRILEYVFNATYFPSTYVRAQLGRNLGMTPRAVQIWFQNKRQSLDIKRQPHTQRKMFLKSQSPTLQGEPSLLKRNSSDPYYTGSGNYLYYNGNNERLHGSDSNLYLNTNNSTRTSSLEYPVNLKGPVICKRTTSPKTNRSHNFAFNLPPISTILTLSSDSRATNHEARFVRGTNPTTKDQTYL